MKCLLGEASWYMHVKCNSACEKVLESTIVRATFHACSQKNLMFTLYIIYAATNYTTSINTRNRRSRDVCYAETQWC